MWSESLIMTSLCCIFLLPAVMAEEYDDFEEERETVEYGGGILSPCSHEFSSFTVVVANGRNLLLRDPRRLQCPTLVCQRKEKLEWIPMQCKPSTENGWVWVGDFHAGELNTFRVYHKVNKHLIFNDTIYFLPVEPPVVQRVEATVGHGYVRLLIWTPAEDVPGLLGYRVSLLDLEKEPHLAGKNLSELVSTSWRVVGEFDAVVYRCRQPHLFPVHPCPEWRRPDHPFCVLLSDSVDWTTAVREGRAITPNTMKYVKVETFRIPLLKYERIYSRGFVLPLYDLEATKRAPPATEKEEEVRASDNGPSDTLSLTHYWTDSLLFLGLTIAVFAVVLPMVHYVATKAGQEEAKTLRSKGQNINLRTGATTEARDKASCSPYRKLKRTASDAKTTFRWRGRLDFVVPEPRT